MTSTQPPTFYACTGKSFVANVSATAPSLSVPSAVPDKQAVLHRARLQLQGMRLDVVRMLRVTRAQVAALHKSFQIAVDAAKTVRRTCLTHNVCDSHPAAFTFLCCSHLSLIAAGAAAAPSHLPSCRLLPMAC